MMIYLIGGPPRCGKTTLARALSARTGASWLSLDQLESAIIYYIPPPDRAAALPFLPGSIDEKYAAFSPQQFLEQFKAIARTIWPGIHILIHYALEENRDLILEGYQLEPAFLRELTPHDQLPESDTAGLSSYEQAMVARGYGYALAHADDARIITVFLYKQDVDKILAGIKQGTPETEWILATTSNEDTLRRIAMMISHYSRYICAEAEQDGCATFDMDQEFNQQIERAIHYFGEKV
jgi:hypothetical protein